MMVSRLVLSLREVNDRDMNVSERTTRPTVFFAPNPELVSGSEAIFLSNTQ